MNSFVVAKRIAHAEGKRYQATGTSYPCTGAGRSAADVAAAKLNIAVTEEAGDDGPEPAWWEVVPSAFLPDRDVQDLVIAL